jgi:hypothetical protein
MARLLLPGSVRGHGMSRRKPITDHSGKKERRTHSYGYRTSDIITPAFGRVFRSGDGGGEALVNPSAHAYANGPRWQRSRTPAWRWTASSVALPHFGARPVDAQPHKLKLPSVLSEREEDLRMRARYQKGCLTKIKRKSGYLALSLARDGLMWQAPTEENCHRPGKLTANQGRS